MKTTQWMGISLLGLALVACGGEEAPKAKHESTPPAAATSTVAVKKPEMPANHEQIKQALASMRTQAADSAAVASDLKTGETVAAKEAAAPATQQTTTPAAPSMPKAAASTPKVAAPAVKDVPAAAGGVISALAAGDAARGKALARKCQTCHNFNERKKVGPGLQGVFGRKAGQMADMKYSNALQQGGWVWNEANLAAWLCDSKKAVKSLSGDAAATTKMPAQRICDVERQADLIAFLKTL